MVLEDQLKQATEELEDKRENIKQIRPSTAKMNKDSHLIKQLENQLEKSNVRFNQLVTENGKLRGEIDVMRKNHKN